MTAMQIFSLAVGIKSDNASIYVELEVRAMISVM